MAFIQATSGCPSSPAWPSSSPSWDSTSSGTASATPWTRGSSRPLTACRRATTSTILGGTLIPPDDPRRSPRAAPAGSRAGPPTVRRRSLMTDPVLVRSRSTSAAPPGRVATASACLPSPTPRKGDTHAEASPLTVRAPVRHRRCGSPGLRPGRARRPARRRRAEEEGPQRRGQGARHPRSAHEHPRADPGHQALHVPGAHALRHQGRQGHHRRGRAGPRRELDALAGRHGVDVQAPEGRAVPQGLRRADRRGRQVQLRAADQPAARARASASTSR